MRGVVRSKLVRATLASLVVGLTTGCPPPYEVDDYNDMCGGVPGDTTVFWTVSNGTVSVDIRTNDGVEAIEWQQNGETLDLPPKTVSVVSDDITSARWNVIVTTSYYDECIRASRDVTTAAELDLAAAYNPIVDTGQTSCYGNTAAVDCGAALPQDAHHKKPPNPRYVKTSGGVLDVATGLEWQDPVSDQPSCPASWERPSYDEVSTMAVFEAVDPELPVPFIPRPSTYYLVGTEGAVTQSVDYRKWCGPVPDKPAALRCVRRASKPWVAGVMAYRSEDVAVDYSTGLWWQADSIYEGQFWDEALAHCRDLSLGGRSDWRLPDYNELRSLSRSGGDDYIKSRRSHWSSTTVPCDPTQAFTSGKPAEKRTSGSAVVCVRGP